MPVVRFMPSFKERLDKFCLYKGMHQGIKQIPKKSDGVQIQGQKNSDAGHEHDRKRRSGDHGKEKEVKQSPKHKKHIKSHYQKVCRFILYFPYITYLDQGYFTVL